MSLGKFALAESICFVSLWLIRNFSGMKMAILL